MTVRPPVHWLMMGAIAAALLAIVAADLWHRQAAGLVRRLEAEVEQAGRRAEELARRQAALGPREAWLERLQAGWLKPAAGPAHAQLIRALAAASQEAGVSMGAVTLSTARAASHIRYTASITVSGTVPGLLQFLHRLEQGPHLGRVDQVHWEESPATAGTGAPGEPPPPRPGAAVVRLSISFPGPPTRG